MGRVYLLVVAVTIAVLYGATYQQFRFFTLADPGGGMDAIHYVAMARSIRPADPDTRHYRWLTPTAARLVQPVARIFVADDELVIRPAFYLVNFTFSLVACLATRDVIAVLRVMMHSSLRSAATMARCFVMRLMP